MLVSSLNKNHNDSMKLDMNTKILLRILIMIFSLNVNFNLNAFASNKDLITINQFVSHVALDAAREGVIESLKNREILPQKADLLVANAQGNIANSVQISKHQASFSPRFMVAIATISAQTILKAKNSESTLAFVAISDPAGTNLIDQKNIIGVTDAPDIAKLIDFSQEIFPQLKNIGVIFNSGEVNSVKIVEKLEKNLQNRNINLKKVSITSSNDIKLAMNKLIGSVDLIYLPQDNSVVSAIDNISAIAKNNNIPLICNDPTLVEKGVLLGFGTDYFKSGVQLGNMIADIIDGKKLDNKIQNTNIQELKINYEISKKMDIIIPENLQTKNK